MVALALLISAVVGIMSMQGTTMRANQDAYETTIATNFARTWLERVKRNATQWTARGENNIPATLPAPLPTPNNQWELPVGLDALESAGADYHGFDVPAAAGARRVYFCANLNLVTAHASSPVVGAPLNVATDADLLRATVRVFWHRFSTAGSDVSDRTFVPLDPVCPVPTDAQLIDAPQRRLRAVYLSTLVRGNFL